MIDGYRRGINTVRFLTISGLLVGNLRDALSESEVEVRVPDIVDNTKIIRKPQGDRDSRTCLAPSAHCHFRSTSETTTTKLHSKKSRPDSLVLYLSDDPQFRMSSELAVENELSQSVVR